MTLVVEYLGWVDFYLGCSTILFGQWVATVAAHQQGELPKSSSSKPCRQTDSILGPCSLSFVSHEELGRVYERTKLSIKIKGLVTETDAFAYG